MTKKLGLFLLLLSLIGLGLIAYRHYRVGFFLEPPHEKLYEEWSSDIQLLERTKSLPPAWKEIHELKVTSDNSPVHEWLERIRPPIATNPKGRYRLDVFFVQWIDNYRYGVMAQYKMIDLTNNNTVWEMGRTYKLGFQY